MATLSPTEGRIDYSSGFLDKECATLHSRIIQQEYDLINREREGVSQMVPQVQREKLTQASIILQSHPRPKCIY